MSDAGSGGEPSVSSALHVCRLCGVCGSAGQPLVQIDGSDAQASPWLHQNLRRGTNPPPRGLAMLLWTPQAVAFNGICIDFASIHSIAIERRFKRSHTRRRLP